MSRAATWILATALASAPVSTVAHAQPAPGAEAAPRAAKIVHTGKAMGTIVQITFWTTDEVAAARAARAVMEELERLDRMMTTWTPDSEVSRINAAAGLSAVAVSAETFTVIERALEISRKSQGVFDITVGAFQGLWKFDQDMDGTLPEPAEVKRRVAMIGWRDVILDRRKRTVKLRRKGMAITLGGIAKGFAVDRAVAILREQKLSDFILQAGGDMFVSGAKGDRPWTVGIRDPRGSRDQTFAVAPVRDHAFSTSGDYERGFVKDGVRYHHILDPRTGQPARLTRSVTILAKDAFTADAWSKVLFILGWEKAMPLVEKMNDFEAAFVDDENQVHVSSGMQGLLKVLHPPSGGV